MDKCDVSARGEMAVVDEARPRFRTVAGSREQVAAWTSRYARRAFALDFAAALLGGLMAFGIRFRYPSIDNPWSTPYIVLSLGLPFLWTGALGLGRGYERQLFGVGPEEFRRILQAGFALTALVAILAYATKTEVARGYVVGALPLTTGFALYGRYLLRKRLHRRRKSGAYMRRVVAVG